MFPEQIVDWMPVADLAARIFPQEIEIIHLECRSERVGRLQVIGMAVCRDVEPLCFQKINKVSVVEAILLGQGRLRSVAVEDEVVDVGRTGRLCLIGNQRGLVRPVRGLVEVLRTDTRALARSPFMRRDLPSRKSEQDDGHDVKNGVRRSKIDARPCHRESDEGESHQDDRECGKR